MTKRIDPAEQNSAMLRPERLTEPKARSAREAQVLRSLFVGILSFTAALPVILGSAGCGAKASSQSETPLISLSMAQIPPTSMIVGGTASVSATVDNDIAHEGVDWVATCASAPNCGSFSPPHTPSGGTTMFIAPLAVPSHNTVTVNALSSTDRSKSFSATVTITSTVTGVVITQPPPASAPAGSTVTVAATVSGDPSNEGLDWKATCGTVDCTPPGAQHSAPGAAFTFVVPGPAQIPTIVGTTVTLTAFATADHSFHAFASFTVAAPLSISLSQPPPSTMVTNATAMVTAVISNDPTNAGVDWSVACFAANNSLCGSVVPAHTASGVAATFTAPATVASPPTVFVTATSTANPNLSITASVTVVNPLSVQITQGVPTNSIAINGTAPLIAAVSNDSSNAGVDWSVICSSAGACGSLSPTHTDSGATTTYTAPSAVPAGGTVTITAAATADATKTAAQTVAVSAGVPPNTLLNGNFVLFLSGKNSVNGPYVLGGLISGDGQGNITGGRLDLVDASGNASPDVGISSGTYSAGADGRAQINLQLNTNVLNGPFGVNGSGSITLSVVFVNPQHALVSETDSFGNGTGTLDLQNANDLAAFAQQGSGAWHNGVYSLTLSGVEASSPFPGYFVAAAAQIDFSTGSYGYVADQSANGAITSVPATTVPGNITFLQQNGKLTFNPVNIGLPTHFQLNAWLIDASHYVVTDWRDSFSGSPSFIAGGYLTAQPASPSLSGTLALTTAGATSTAQPQVAGGTLTCGSSGVLDVVPLAGAATSNAPVSAACIGPANGRALIAISGSSTGVSQFAAYPTVDQGWNLIELDGGSAGTSGPSGAGIAFAQTLATPIPGSTFNGAYASNYVATTANGSQSFAGQITSDGVSGVAGTVDVNSFSSNSSSPSSGAAVAGMFTSADTGRFPLTFTLTPASGQPVPQIGTLDSVCYVLDANTCLLLGVDPAAPGIGILLLQHTGL